LFCYHADRFPPGGREQRPDNVDPGSVFNSRAIGKANDGICQFGNRESQPLRETYKISSSVDGSYIGSVGGLVPPLVGPERGSSGHRPSRRDPSDRGARFAPLPEGPSDRGQRLRPHPSQFFPEEKINQILLATFAPAISGAAAPRHSPQPAPT